MNAACLRSKYSMGAQGCLRSVKCALGSALALWLAAVSIPVHAEYGDVVLNKRAEKEGVRLLLENEVSCNVGTCAETAKILKMVPSKALGVNWDVMNGEDLKEPAVDIGYKLLPKDRLWNVQVKGRSLLDDAKKIDWPAIVASLQRDRYPGRIGLETHMFGRMLFTHSHYCIREMIRIVEGV